jgi:cell division protein FtsW
MLVLVASAFPPQLRTANPAENFSLAGSFKIFSVSEMKAAVTTLAFCVAALLALGLVMLYSASMMQPVKNTNTEVGATMLQKQVLWCVLGIIACAVVTAIDYALLKKIAWPVFIFTLFFAVLVFVPHIGMSLNGAHRWIRVPGVGSLQPSELVKIGLIVIVAWYVDRNQRRMNTFVRGLMMPGAIIGVALALIFKEPDRGTTILLAGVTGWMLLIAGVRLLHLVPIGILAAGALAFSISHDGMRSGRIDAWLHPEKHVGGKADQGLQAKLALGSGGLVGLGLGDGRQKLGFLPMIESDFIFANIGEELGLIGTAGVVLAFLLISVCGIYIAFHARDPFGTQLAIGITALICFQAIINIAVVTSLFPNKGIALPFISHGGSSLLAMLTGVGILFSVARRATPGKISVTDERRAHGRDNDNPFAARAKSK